MSRFRIVAAGSALLLAASTAPALAGGTGHGGPGHGKPGGPKPPAADQTVAEGSGGAVAMVDADATAAGLEVLRRGGNAVDAAVASAAALGVTEPYSGGIGGGGFLLAYAADRGEVVAFDGREDAPDDPAFDETVFVDRTDDFDDAVNSGLSVGTPGVVATWDAALEQLGTWSLGDTLEPAIRTAEKGFVVDETFAQQTEDNLERFREVVPTADLFLVDGEVPEVGTKLRNPDLADTYREIAEHGAEAFYTGEIADDVIATVQDPPVAEDATGNWEPGLLTTDDLATYDLLQPDPIRSDFAGHEVVGFPAPSSGGIAVAQTLSFLDQDGDLAEIDDVEVEHRFQEASALAFADRGAYLADDRYVDVPREGLLDADYLADRWSLFDPAQAADKPVAPGDPCPYEPGPCEPAAEAATDASGSTTHLVTADRWGNVVSYTFTIEQTGGSALTVPGRGFILNNELTDFEREGDGPNLPELGKRPRSSMSPTIVLDEKGAPTLAVGSPGGATIITTVAAIVRDRLGRDVPLPDAVAAPRSAPLNIPEVPAEPGYLDAYGDGLTDLGHVFDEVEEIGAATAIELRREGQLQAVAEPERRGGGSAAVVHTKKR